MKREIVLTDDGSTTIFLPACNECYHSLHGAVSESNHIFINAGLKYVLSKQTSVSILEVGFGTGLNAFLTAMHSTGTNHTIYYIGVEPYPLSETEISALNYIETGGFPGFDDCFRMMHRTKWNKASNILPHFQLIKIHDCIENILLPTNSIDLVYFDAFAPAVQPEMWQRSIFEKIYCAMKPMGVLVTYSCKGEVKRALKECGFIIQKLPGPKGKREFLRAEKLSV